MSMDNNFEQKTEETPASEPSKKNKKKIILIVAGVVLALALIGGAVYAWQTGLFSQSDLDDDEYEEEEIEDVSDTKKRDWEEDYNKKYDEKEPENVQVTPIVDDDTYYVYATHVMLRSAPDASTKANIIVKPSYGSIVHIPNPEAIRYDGKNSFWYGYYDSINRYEGYVAMDYLMTKTEFTYFQSILGDGNAISLIGLGSNKKGCGEARYKRALLDYFKRNNYVGNLTDMEIRQLGLDPSRVQRWTVHCRYPEATTNNVYHGKISNGEVDFAVIIQDNSGNRRLLCFCFDANERISFAKTIDAPSSGYLKKVYRAGNTIRVEYEI